MLRNARLFVIAIVALILFVLAFGLYHLQKSTSPQPDQKPAQKKTADTPKQQEKWYIEFTAKDQKSTAYTEAVNAPVSSAGEEYFIGSGAVHPRYPINDGGEARNPIIPFGTTLYLEKPVDVQGQKYTQLVVNDTGDVYYGLWPSHPYWVDVYFGATNYYNQQTASQAGVKVINYTWYEPWPDE